MSEKITFETEDGDIELYVLEQTTLFWSELHSGDR